MESKKNFFENKFEGVFEPSESLRPCVQVVNGFRLVPQVLPYYVDKVFQSFVTVWFIHPNKSNRTFWFKNLGSAKLFAKQFTNNHSDAFWFKRWSPIFSFNTIYETANLFTGVL